MPKYKILITLDMTQLLNYTRNQKFMVAHMQGHVAITVQYESTYMGDVLINKTIKTIQFRHYALAKCC